MRNLNLHQFISRNIKGLIVLFTFFAYSLFLQAEKKNSKKLKVFILAGQSNMQGHSAFSVLDHLKTDPKLKPFYDKMVDEDGKPRKIDRVWISFLNEGKRENGHIAKSITKSGPLMHGYGATGNEMGPELAFGIAMSELYDGPILIIKSAFGGSNLHTQWRSPSSGPWTVDEISKDFNLKGKDPQAWVDETNKNAGFLYRWTVEHARKVLADPKKIVPVYDEEAGYEVAGFAWFQGCNDKSGPSYLKKIAGGHAKYTDYLANMIRDLRRDLKAPNMLFSIGAQGKKWCPSLYAAQMGIAEVPEFKGQAFAFDILPFVDPVIEQATEKWNKMKYARGKWERENNWKAKWKASKTREEKQALTKLKNEFQDTWYLKNATAEERYALKHYISAFGYHYSGSAKFFTRTGAALAKALMNEKSK